MTPRSPQRDRGIQAVLCIGRTPGRNIAWSKLWPLLRFKRESLHEE